MEVTVETLHHDMLRMQHELETLKALLFNEGELTPWARKALKVSRAQSESEYTSLENL